MQNNMSKFEDVLQDVRGIIIKYASRISNTVHLDFDDASQELNIAAWSSFQKYESKRNVKISTFLYKCISMKARDIIYEYRKHNNIELLSEEDLSTFLSPIDEQEIFNIKIFLDEFEEKLQKENTTAYNLFVYLRSGYSFSDVAKMLHVTKGYISKIWKQYIFQG